MKKNILGILLALCLPTSLLYAMVDEDIWIYSFNFEMKQGVLAINSDEKFPYRIRPMAYEGSGLIDNFDFYGTITSGRGIKLAQFGFNKPTTEVAALGKSVFTVDAPYFANADHITVYKSGGAKLLTISVKNNSFCNDDNKCNDEIENYRNCPNDCPAPVNIEPATPPLTQVSNNNPPQEGVSLVSRPSDIPSSAPASASARTTRAVAFVTGILAVILGTILWFRRRHTKNSVHS